MQPADPFYCTCCDSGSPLITYNLGELPAKSGALSELSCEGGSRLCSLLRPSYTKAIMKY